MRLVLCGEKWWEPWCTLGIQKPRWVLQANLKESNVDRAATARRPLKKFRCWKREAQESRRNGHSGLFAAHAQPIQGHLPLLPVVPHPSEQMCDLLQLPSSQTHSCSFAHILLLSGMHLNPLPTPSFLSSHLPGSLSHLALLVSLPPL